MELDRRRFLHHTALATVGAGVVFSMGLRGGAQAAAHARDGGFVFAQLSDTHWGFDDPKIAPEAEHGLPRAIDALNALSPRPDFVVFTGDLTHTTDDGDERRRRMARFAEIVRGLRVTDVKLLPGEHDASLDGGAAFREHFGDTHYAFDHRGVHFVALDNVSDPTGQVGAAQLGWLADDLASRDAEQPIVVLAHRPLFDLAPDWDWATRDGAQVTALLERFRHVTVFYGHIHQEHHRTIGNVAHHAATSLIFPLPAPHAVPKKAPIPWNPERPWAGLGFRTVAESDAGKRVTLAEQSLASR